MTTYILRRLLLMIPTLLVVTIIVFFLSRMIPGDIIELMLSEQAIGASSELSRTELDHRLGLDVPVHVQYQRWLGIAPSPDTGFHGVLQGNLGRSLWTDAPVRDEILSRLTVTIELGLMAVMISLLLALPVGIYSAIRQDTSGDLLARTFAILLISVPSFWVGTIVTVLPSIWWHWSPPTRFVSFLQNPTENLKILIIPAFILGMALSGVVMRMTRTMMLEVLRLDYIRTAWAKGLRERTIVFRHALKNALIPVVTVIGIQIPFVVAGTVILEQIFNLPGIGRFLLTSLSNRDYTVISGINLFVATLVLLINLGVDLIYAYLDPRIQYK
jgi:peptide/nickel transport system permease protein